MCMKIAYFDCFCGAGGDMIVAAMIDAGLSEELLKAAAFEPGYQRSRTQNLANDTLRNKSPAI